jgi:hypothetical protein
MPIFVGYAMTGAVYHSNVAIKTYKRHGKVWHRQSSEYLQAHEVAEAISSHGFKVRWKNIAAVAVRSILSLIG